MSETVKKIIRSKNIGVKDLYIAEVTENTSTSYKTATPFRLSKLASLKIKEKWTTENEYYDDCLDDTIESYEGTEIEVTVKKVVAEDLEQLLNIIYKNGCLVKSSSDTSKEIALMCRAKQKNGKYDFIVLYVGRMTERPEIEYTTLKNKIETKDITLKFNFYARKKVDTIDGEEKNFYELRVDESNVLEGATNTKAALEKWFTEVQEPVLTTSTQVSQG